MRFSSPYDVVVRTTISTCLTRSAVEDSAVSERKNTESGNVTVRIQNPNGLREGKESLIQSRSYKVLQGYTQFNARYVHVYRLEGAG